MKLKKILPLLLSATAFFAEKTDAQNGYVIEKLGDNVNSSDFDEVTPIVTHDGGTIYFTRVGSGDFNKTIWIDGKDVSEEFTYKDYVKNLRDIYSEIAGHTVFDVEKSDYNQDIWYVESREREFDHIVHPPSPLNNALPNSICSLTPDADAFVVVNQFSKTGGMNHGFSLVRRNEDGSWTDPEPMQIDNYNITSAAISLTMSSDGNVLVMSLPKFQGASDNDLFISFKIGDNHYSTPKNLGAPTNSIYREVTPHLSADGRELYFASNRPPSVGGLDLFFVSRLDDTWLNWTKPRRFVEPINTYGDESQPYFNTATGYLYFSSKRSGTHDIYRVKIAPDVPQEVYIKGRIVNTMTGQLVDGRVLFGDASAPYFEKYMESIEGNFLIKVKQGQPIRLIAHKPGYINHEVVLNFDKREYFNKPREVTLYLDSVAVGGTISLNSIYFKRSTPVILPESYAELDYLIEILQRFSEINITVEGHTDNNGTAETLQKLSLDRSNEVRKYLVSHKINPKRISVVGFGATRPLSTNNTEESRQLNRRVEFRITKLAF